MLQTFTIEMVIQHQINKGFTYLVKFSEYIDVKLNLL